MDERFVTAWRDGWDACFGSMQAAEWCLVCGDAREDGQDGQHVPGEPGFHARVPITWEGMWAIAQEHHGVHVGATL
jgi:hypothetical protein